MTSIKTIKDLETVAHYSLALNEDALQQEKTISLYNEDLHVYTPETEMPVLELIDYGVSFERIPMVLQSTSKLFGQTIASRVQSERTIREMNHRRLAISHMHLADIMPNKEDTTLLSDETPDSGATYEGFHIADEEGRVFVVGLREMPNKAARTIMETFEEILSDIDQAKGASGGDADVGAQIVSRVRLPQGHMPPDFAVGP